MSTVSLSSLRAESIRLVTEVAKPSFGGFVRQAGVDVFALGRMREDLATSVSDGAVSEVDLLKVGHLLAVVGKAAAVSDQATHVSDEDIRTELGKFWLSLEADPKPEQLAAEIAKITPEQIAHRRTQLDLEAKTCAAEVGVLAALHGAIQAQLGAQPGHVSAMEYMKDNAERLGVTGAVRDLKSKAEALSRVELTQGAKDALTSARKAVENQLGKWFGSR